MFAVRPFKINGLVVVIVPVVVLSGTVLQGRTTTYHGVAVLLFVQAIETDCDVIADVINAVGFGQVAGVLRVAPIDQSLISDGEQIALTYNW